MNEQTHLEFALAMVNTAHMVKNGDIEEDIFRELVDELVENSTDEPQAGLVVTSAIVTLAASVATRITNEQGSGPVLDALREHAAAVDEEDSTRTLSLYAAFDVLDFRIESIKTSLSQDRNTTTLFVQLLAHSIELFGVRQIAVHFTEICGVVISLMASISGSETSTMLSSMSLDLAASI